MNFMLISLSIIIIFLLFIIYRFIMASKTSLVTNMYLKTGIPEIQLEKLKIKDYSNYSIEFWIYVNELPTDMSFTSFPNNNYYNKYGLTNHSNGCIFQTSDSNLSLDLYSDNVLTFFNGRKIAAVTAVLPVAANPTANPPVLAVPAVAAVPGDAQPSVLTNNFPVQQWTCVAISVRNNSLVDLFINGKLIQSAIYNGSSGIDKILKPISSKNIQFGTKLNAYITKMYINNSAMDTNTAWKNYLKGNNTSATAMNISLNLTQNGKDSNKIQLL